VSPARSRILACNINALTKEQRARHEAVTRRLLQHAPRKDLANVQALRVAAAMED
jgi:hypothetical protein